MMGLRVGSRILGGEESFANTLHFNKRSSKMEAVAIDKSNDYYKGSYEITHIPNKKTVEENLTSRELVEELSRLVRGSDLALNKNDFKGKVEIVDVENGLQMDEIVNQGDDSVERKNNNKSREPESPTKSHTSKIDAIITSGHSPRATQDKNFKNLLNVP